MTTPDPTTPRTAGEYRKMCDDWDDALADALAELDLDKRTQRAYKATTDMLAAVRDLAGRVERAEAEMRRRALDGLIADGQWMETTDKMAKALRAVEWLPDSEYPGRWCPVCGGWDDRGHAPDCLLAAALGGGGEGAKPDSGGVTSDRSPE
jgi:hypothetical protein